MLEQIPYISIILPVYNAEKTLDRCLNSLLVQDYPSEYYEIIVINNKSTDKSSQILKRYSIKILEEDDIQSLYAARNIGIHHSEGDILAFTDADCFPHPQWLLQGVLGFENEQVGAVAGEISPFTSTHLLSQYLTLRNMLSQDTSMSHPFLPYAQTANVFYRKDVFETIGYFEDWPAASDIDFSWRMQLKSNYKILFKHEAIVERYQYITKLELFHLFLKRGLGATYIFQKYSQHLPKRQLNQTIKDIWYLCKYLIPHALASYIYKSNIEKQYDLVSFLGYKIGMLQGSLRNKVYYC